MFREVEGGRRNVFLERVVGLVGAVPRAEELVFREVSLLGPDRVPDVIGQGSVAVVAVRLQDEVGPLLRAQLGVDVAESRQSHVGLKQKLSFLFYFLLTLDILVSTDLKSDLHDTFPFLVASDNIM